jgi:uncharacterized protein YndB with AHSA1/START domain
VRRDLVVERSYPHPPSRVWRALTDPVALARWLMPNDFRLEPGAPFRFRTTPRRGSGGAVACRVLEVAAPHTLVYTWQGSSMRHPTLVRFTLRPLPGGTHLRLEHRGFEGPAAVGVSLLLGSAWRRRLRRRLPAALAGLAAAAAPPPAGPLLQQAPGDGHGVGGAGRDEGA